MSQRGRPPLRRDRETASADDPEADGSAAGTPLDTGSLERGTELGPRTGERRSVKPHAELRSAVTKVGERLDQIIAQADRTADELRRDAEAEAEAIRAQAHLDAERRAAEGNRGVQRAIEAMRLGLDRIEAEATRAIGSVEKALDSARQPPGAEAPAHKMAPSASAPAEGEPEADGSAAASEDHHRDPARDRD